MVSTTSRSHEAAPRSIGVFAGASSDLIASILSAGRDSQCAEKRQCTRRQHCGFTADNPLSTHGRCVRCSLMAIDIRPFQEADRPVVRQLTIAAFEGVSIDHNIDLRLGLVAGRDWRCRKSRDIDRDIDELGA